MSSPSPSGEWYSTVILDEVINEWKFLLIMLFQRLIVAQLHLYGKTFLVDIGK